MMETDADRLDSIQAVGGTLASVSTGQFWAIFDNEYFSLGGGDVEIEDRSPALICRTSDVEANSLAKDAVISFQGKEYRMRRHEPDGTGMSRLILSS